METTQETDSTPIDLDRTPTAAPEPSRPRALIALATGALFVAVGAIFVAWLVVAKFPTPAAAAPIVTHQVTLEATGTTQYYDASGPNLNLSGSTMPGTLVVPVGTHIHVIAIANADTPESVCSIKVDGAVLGYENGLGDGAASECDVVVK